MRPTPLVRGQESIEVAIQTVVESQAPLLHLDPDAAERLRALGHAQ